MSSDVLRSELLTPRGHRSMSCSHTQGTEARVDKSVLKQYSWITVQWLTVCCAWRPHIMIYSGFALLWFSIGSDQYWWCPAVQLELQGTGWSWWEHFEEKSGRVHNFPWTLSHLEGNWLEISQTTTFCYMLDFIARFVLVWKLTSYWFLASWFHLIWLCIGELTRRIQA